MLVVDPERKRISLTAKKTLLDSTLSIISKVEDAVPGAVAHAVVFKLNENNLLIEFYNNVKAIVPSREIRYAGMYLLTLPFLTNAYVSDTPKGQLSESFPIGRPVRVRILSNDGGRITASIRQATSAFDVVSDISAIEIGNTVRGKVSEIHKDNAVLTLQPSHIRALLSLKNLANHRNSTVAQLRASLQVGENLEELVVVTRNPEKGIVLVANKPKTRATLLPKSSTITMESITIGQFVGGRVTRHTRHGALIKITSSIGGILHLTDITDNFEVDSTLPPVDSIIKATVIGIETAKKQLTLSTRPSRMHPDEAKDITDREVAHMSDLHVGQQIRGFVKSIADHGLFVTIGREIDARVQIRELFDEVRQMLLFFTVTLTNGPPSTFL